MTEFEKILMEDKNKPTSNNKHKPNINASSRETYAESKKEKRDHCYSMIQDACVQIERSPIALKSFLNVMSRFERYSLNNNLLIFAQKPTAIKLKDRMKVMAENQSIRSGTNAIYILEPEKVKGEDGEWTRYNAVSKFDVVDLENEPPVVEVAYDQQMKIRALVSNSPVKIQTVDPSEYPKAFSSGAYYDVQQNLIIAKRDMSFQEIFLSVAEALAHAEMKRDYEGEYHVQEHAFEAKCTAYTLAKKYEFSTDSIDIPPFVNPSGNENHLKECMGRVHKNVKNIQYRMFQKLEPQKEQQRNDGEAR